MEACNSLGPLVYFIHLRDVFTTYKKRGEIIHSHPVPAGHPGSGTCGKP